MIDFLVIGAMKSGTTTLARALELQPDIEMAALKEPSFFSRDDRWQRGPGWYMGLFPKRSGLLGEASTSYTSPRYASVAAERIHHVSPRVRLIYLLRHPVERARSHYRHQVQRGRETRPFLTALADDQALYLAQSHYWSCLRPYAERFPRDQILVVRFEDMWVESDSAWPAILSHLGLPHRPLPSGTKNVTASKPQYTLLLRFLWEKGLVPRTSRAPSMLRRVGLRLLTKSESRYERQLANSNVDIPPSMTASLWNDIERLETWLGAQDQLWPRL